MGDVTFWGFHVDSPAAQQLLLSGGQLAIGWHEAGDLSSLSQEREILKKRLAEVLPSAKPGAIPVYAGQLYRFVQELAINDVVAYRAKSENRIYLVRVTGPYQWDTTSDPEHPNRRPVEVLKDVPITAVSQGALYELGAAMSFFQLKNYADEWSQLLAGTSPPTADSDTDQSVASVSEATVQNTRDFILKRLAKDLKGHPFTHLVAHLLETMGYRTRVAPPGVDGGVDIVAHRDELGFEPPIIRVQVKSGEGSVGGPVVSELLGNLGVGEYGLVVTLGTFTPQARTKAKSNMRLIDGDELVDLILDHYEEFDPAHKSLIPLRRMYVPQLAVED